MMREDFLHVNTMFILCVEWRKEFDEILCEYEEDPIDTLFLKLSYNYYAIHMLSDVVWENYFNHNKEAKYFSPFPNTF